MHRAGEGGDVGERGAEVEVLERASSHHLRRHLTGDGQRRRAVDLGVVEPGEQVGRAGPGDREAGRRTARELAERRRSERRGTLVAHADEREVAAFLRRDASRRRSRGSSDRPCRTRGSRPTRPSCRPARPTRSARGTGSGGSATYTPSPRTSTAKQAGASVKPGRWGAGGGVVVVAVPRATQVPALDRPFAERASLVRAVVVEGPVASPSWCVSARLRRPTVTVVTRPSPQLIDLGDLVPGRRSRRPVSTPASGSRRRRAPRRATAMSRSNVVRSSSVNSFRWWWPHARASTCISSVVARRKRSSRCGGLLHREPGAQVRLLGRDPDRAVVGVAGAHPEASDGLDGRVGDRHRVGTEGQRLGEVGARGAAPRSPRASRRGARGGRGAPGRGRAPGWSGPRCCRGTPAVRRRCRLPARRGSRSRRRATRAASRSRSMCWAESFTPTGMPPETSRASSTIRRKSSSDVPSGKRAGLTPPGVPSGRLSHLGDAAHHLVARQVTAGAGLGALTAA